jgi:hypothetical protein
MFDRNYDLTAELIWFRTEYNNNDYEIQETAYYVIKTIYTICRSTLSEGDICNNGY